MESETSIDEVGYVARLIDTEMTILERMKIKKSTMYRIIGALSIYSITMIIFAITL
jgi:hypothetical protein